MLGAHRSRGECHSSSRRRWISPAGAALKVRSHLRSAKSTTRGASRMTSFPTARSTPKTTSTLSMTGNRLVLTGVLIYFCEWLAIVGAGGIDVLFEPGTSPAKVLAGYAGHGNAFAWAAGWFSVVLLGRVLFAIGLRHGLRASGHDDPLAEFGVLAMLGGVIF